MNRILSGVLVGGAVLAAATLGAIPANASTHSITSIVSWRGANCIQDESPQINNLYLTSVGTICGGSSTASYTAGSGAWVGSNPIMGAASYISCQLWVDGHLEWSDFANAGDGHDANCLRILN